MSSVSGLSPEDFAEIHNLYAYYNLCSDAGDADGYASCFAEKGVLRIDGIGLRHEGRETLRAFKRADAARRGTRYRRHWNGSLHLQRQPDGSVTGRCYLHGYNGEPGQPPELADVGSYVDRLVKENGAWCYAERSITMDASSFKAPK
ncbi:MAG: nuclear transport factor 2 family protein [Hyphomicrobiaceae bacterium]